MQTYLPLIEDAVPLPKSATEAMPRLTVFEEIEMRARTLKLLSDLSLVPIEPSHQDACEAARISQEITKNPAERPDLTQYPNEVMSYLAGMIQQSNMQLVNDLSEIKMYVVNKLIAEVEGAKDSKNRIAALSKLGEIDGIDAFKKRTSVEHTYKDAKEVEDALVKVLEGIEYHVVEAEDAEISEIQPENGSEDAENRQDCTVGGDSLQ